MMVKFGVLCDLCGAGSRDYAQDASACRYCMRDLCDSCAAKTSHVVVNPGDCCQECGPKLFDCEDAEHDYFDQQR